jgi:SAM-dependent methyltransferase
MEHYYHNIGEDWFTYPQLYKNMVERYDGNFLEIGCWKGRSSCFLAVEIINSKKDINLYCVDTWKGSQEHINFQDIKDDNLYETFLQTIQPVKHIITPIRDYSVNASCIFNDEFFDFIFIDASHKYEDVKNDIECWYPKLKKGGFIAGHDYGNGWNETEKAVNEWILENNLSLEISGKEFVWGLTKK